MKTLDKIEEELNICRLLTRLQSCDTIEKELLELRCKQALEQYQSKYNHHFPFKGI